MVPRILVVEDEALVAQHICLVTGRLGFEVAATTATGEEAVQLASELVPDLILMDIRLAGEMDGIEAARQISAVHSIPIVFLTAYSSDTVFQRAIQSDPFGYVLKPFEERSLLATMHMALHKHRLEKQLREGEERYHSLFQQNQEVMLLVDPSSGRVLDANPAACQFYGWNLPTLLEKRLADLEAPQLTTVGDQVPRHLRADGSVREVEVYTSPLTIDGQPHSYLILHDVTERRQRQREMQVMAEISAAMRNVETDREFLTMVLDRLIVLFNAEGASILLYDAPHGGLFMNAARGLWEKRIGERFELDSSASGWVYQNRMPMVNNQVYLHPKQIRMDMMDGIECAVCVPLLVREGCSGVLWVGGNMPFGQEEARMIAAVADLAAGAIQRSRLYEATQRQLQRLQALREVDLAITSSQNLAQTLQLVTDQVLDQLRARAAVIFQNSETDGPHLAAASGFDYPNSILELLNWSACHSPAETHSHLTGLPVCQCSCQADCPALSFLAIGPVKPGGYVIPLVSNHRSNGRLCAFFEDPCLDGEQAQFLDSLARQAAIAIDNMSLYEGMQRSLQRQAEAYDETIAGWARALELRDIETSGHSVRVTELTLELARRMGVTHEQLVHIRRGALLHDVGKMGIPDSILKKPGPLTDEEWQIMRLHPVHAYNLLSRVEFILPALDIPYHHHEKWDGSGYPGGLKGEDIPLTARMFAIVDVWDSLLSRRYYRSEWSQADTIAYLRQQSGLHFDPQVLRCFLEMVEEKCQIGQLASLR